MNKDTVGILLPTRGRYPFFEDSLTSLAKTVDSEKIDLYILADQDKTSLKIANNFSLKHQFNSYKVVYSAKRLYPVKAFLSLYELCDSFYFFWMTNRVTYNDRNWMVNAINLFEQLFNDRIGVLAMGGKLNKANVGMSSKAFVKYNHNEWFFPEYKINYCDDELACRAILLGRYFLYKSPGIEISSGGSLLYPSLEEKRKLKRRDRSIFYTRSVRNFYLSDDEIYKWAGFRDINQPLLKKEE